MNAQKEKEWNTLDLADRATIYANQIHDDNKDEYWDWGAVRDLKFAELVRADEREQCAKECESIGQHKLITMCAAAIRGRTE
jgi:hypothetical protein